VGSIRFGAPHELIQLFRKQFSLRTFVETGTFRGGTAAWAASCFEQVITIEASETIYKQTSSKYADIANINFLFGDSRKLLAQVVSALPAPALFWLDSHWCSEQITYGEKDECPVLDEIKILNASPLDHFILIDDARLFSSPPALPYRIDQWPALDQVFDHIKAGPYEKYIVISEDVIIAVPKAARRVLAPWLQAINTRTIRLAPARHKGRLRHGLGLIRQGSDLIIRAGLEKARSLKFGR